MFDAYHKWLAIPPDCRPPTYYQLLGVAPDEADPEVIEEAAIRQTAHVRTYQTSPRAAECTRLLNEIARAKATLLNPARRAEYDAQLLREREVPLAWGRLPACRKEQADWKPAPQTHNRVFGMMPYPILPADGASEVVEPRPGGRGGIILVAASLVLLVTAGAIGFHMIGPPDGRARAARADAEPAAPLAPVAPAQPAPTWEDTGEVGRFEGHEGHVNAVAVSADGRFALSGGGGSRARDQATGPRDFSLRMWELKTGREVRRFRGHQAPVNSVAFSPDGLYVVSGSGGYGYRDWHRIPVDCTVRLWDIELGEEVQCFKGHWAPVRGVAFSPDGRRVYTCSEDMTIRLWDLRTGDEVRRAEGSREAFRSLAVSADGRRVLSGGAEGGLCLWDPETWRPVRTFARAEGPVHAVALALDGRRAVSASSPEGDDDEPGDGTVRLWDVETGREVRRFAGHAGPVYAVAFSPDGRRALSGGKDKILRLWDVATCREVRRFEGHLSEVRATAFTPDGRRAVSAGHDRSVFLWTVPPLAGP